jgi:hypothetical protein
MKGCIEMETIFYTLQDFMLHSKNITYILIGGILIGLMLFWLFLAGRDEKKRTF